MSEATTVTPFADNWTYLKAELAWLDRVLMRAMAKQKQANFDIDRVARSAADKATSHWWRGFMVLDPAQGGRQVPPEPIPPCIHPLGRFGDRLAASLEQGIELALPTLCQRLNLGKYERDFLVLCLAPEISRRYERLYAVLNNDEANCHQPTVDLGLRLFCRSDAEWREARATLTPHAPLLKAKVIEILPSLTTARSLIARPMHLNDKVVNYLLGEPVSLDDVLPKQRKRRSASSDKASPK